jgi:hypothetical protein
MSAGSRSLERLLKPRRHLDWHRIASSSNIRRLPAWNFDHGRSFEPTKGSARWQIRPFLFNFGFCAAIQANVRSAPRVVQSIAIFDAAARQVNHKF